MTDATGAPQVPDSTEADSRAENPSKARRRLILAAGAVLPSIYTLSSGAQTAAASNLVCLSKQGPPPIRFTKDEDYARVSDGWLRAPVNFGEYDGVPADCITSPQTSCVAFGADRNQTSNGSPSPDGVHGVNAEDGSTWVVQGNRVISSSSVPITNVSMGRKHYGLVYVDQTGTIATLDPNGAVNLSPVTTSCWTSIMGGRISKLG
jgi:hypothetical protein